MAKLVSIVALCFLAGLAVAHLTRGTESDTAKSSGDRAKATSVAAREQPPAERFGSSIDVEPGSRLSLGEFRLSGGRSLRLYSVQTKKGKSCLVDEDSSVGQSAGCFERGLFAERKAVFSVSTKGGPERFDELYLIGIAAPGIRAVEVVRTDRSVTPVELDSKHAFLYWSRPADLQAGVHPTALRLYGAAGQLVETITFPPAG